MDRMRRLARRSVWLGAPAALVATLGLLPSAPAEAKLGFGGGCGGGFCAFDSPAGLRGDGRGVRVAGHVTCDAVVEGRKLHVTVTQESTTASVRAVITSDCKAGPIHFAADLEETPTAPPFEPGKALACGMRVTGEGDRMLHAGFWGR
jgi:hypothetical protein